jgi:hypothetical protein
MGYHDAAEDHGGMLRLKDIEHNFGKNVARMVEGLSNSLTDDPGNKQSWQTRKESYIERLRDSRPRASMEQTRFSPLPKTHKASASSPPVHSRLPHANSCKTHLAPAKLSPPLNPHLSMHFVYHFCRESIKMTRLSGLRLSAPMRVRLG